jgi:ABC-2 type transport system ATP-binding protein
MAAENHPAPTPRTRLPRPVTEAIEVLHLRKTYGATVAVDDVSFSVAEGEIFGILGPNGAGKTTSVECVIGLRSPDAGLIRVMGLDPHRDREGLHAIVAVWAICFAEGDVF